MRTYFTALSLTLALSAPGCAAYNACERDDPENIAECCRQCADNPTVDDCVPVCAGSCDCSGADGGPDAGRDGGDTGVPDTGPGDAGDDAGPCGMTCPAATPLCDATSGACVECLGTGDCSAPTALCDTTSNMCVACLGNADCTDPAMPICETGVCRACAADTDCTTMLGAPVCDELSGRCVECTIDTEIDECAAFSCSSLTNTCTTTLRGLLDVCDACEADSECTTDRRCVMHTFMGTDIGYFCFFDLDLVGGCGDTDMARQPYSTRIELDSIDGVTATYCMPPSATTCQGIRDTRSVACTMDTECGVTGEDDGYCPPPGPPGGGLCSYLCGGDVDCRSTLNCLGGPAHCRPPL